MHTNSCQVEGAKKTDLLRENNLWQDEGGKMMEGMRKADRSTVAQQAESCVVARVPARFPHYTWAA